MTHIFHMAYEGGTPRGRTRFRAPTTVIVFPPLGGVLAIVMRVNECGISIITSWNCILRPRERQCVVKRDAVLVMPVWQLLTALMASNGIALLCCYIVLAAGVTHIILLTPHTSAFVLGGLARDNLV